MVDVSPQQEACPDTISRVQNAITITPKAGRIEFGEGDETVRGFGSICQRRGIAEKFATVVDRSVSITVAAKEGIVASRRRPRRSVGSPIRVQVEPNTVRCVRQAVTVVVEIEDDRRPTVASRLAIIATAVRHFAMTGAFRFALLQS